MPNKHRYAPITPRVPRELKDRAQNAADEMHTDLTALITTFLRWYVGDLNGLPERPVPSDHVKASPIMQLIECKICHAESQTNPSRANQTPSPANSYRHPITDFPPVYGRNVDSGNDLRADNCGIFGVNTGAKLAEHHLPWGWIDEITGARLCCNEDEDERRSCARELFHEGHHRDLRGSIWPQHNHHMLTRLEVDGAMRHLNLYGTREEAQLAASYDLGNTDTLEWTAQQRAFQHSGKPKRSNRVAYLVTFINVGQIGEEIAAVQAARSNVSTYSSPT
jgi:hypothetical protein